jgi:hypothetical protein
VQKLLSSSSIQIGQGQRTGGHPAGASGGLGRRRRERLGARAPREKGRGRRGDQALVLTGGGEERGGRNSSCDGDGCPASSSVRQRQLLCRGRVMVQGQG